MCMMNTCLDFALKRAQGVILCNGQNRTNNGHFDFIEICFFNEFSQNFHILTGKNKLCMNGT